MAYQLSLNNPLEGFTRNRQASEDELRRKQEALLAAEEQANAQLNANQIKGAQMAEEASAKTRNSAFALGEKAIGIADQYYDNKIKNNALAEERALKQEQIQKAQEFEMGKLMAQQDFERPYKEADVQARNRQLDLQGQNLTADSDYQNKSLAQQLKIAQINNASKEEIASLRNALQQSQASNKADTAISPGQRAVDTDFAKDYNDWTSGGAEKAQAEIGKLEKAVAKLGERKVGQTGEVTGGVKTGGVTKYLPDVVTSDELLGVRADVKSSILNSLKAIYGPAFTEGEGQRALETTWNEADSTENNVARLKAKIADLKSEASAKNAKSQHFQQTGTLSGFRVQPSPAAVADAPGASATPLPDWKSKVKQKPMPASR